MDCEAKIMKNKILTGIVMAYLILGGTACSSWFGSKNAEPLPLRQSLTREEAQALLDEVSGLQTQVDARKYKAARKIAVSLKATYPQIADYDLQDFLKAELALAKDKIGKSVRTYETFLTDYPDSVLRETAIKRLYGMGLEYVNGKKKRFLWIIPYHGYATGIKILDQVTEFDGLEDPNGLGVKSAVAVAENYEKRSHFEDAYLKWLEISTVWQDGALGRQALLGMARNKHAIYNHYSKAKRPFFDASSLKAAKTYYEKFKLNFPDDAETLNVDATIEEIIQQMAYKEYTVAQYYQRTGQPQAANIYYDMVIENWPDTKAAQMARESLSRENQ